MFDQIVKVFQQFQVGKNFKLQINNSGMIEKRPQNNMVIINSREVDLTGQITSTARHQAYQQIEQDLNNRGLKIDLQVISDIRGTFKDYGQLNNVLNQNKTRLMHQNNQILLINVWATWNQDCYQGLKQYQQILQRNEQNWDNKVRIIGLNIDDKRQQARQKILSQNWSKIIHINVQGWFRQHPFIRDYKIYRIPFIVLVNKWGKVDYIGDPDQINIQNRIKQLLLQTSDTSLITNSALSINETVKQPKSQNLFQTLLKRLEIQQIQKLFKDINFIILRYSLQSKLQKSIETNHFQVETYIIDGDQIAENKVKEYFKVHQNLQLKFNKVKYINIPFVEHPECFMCNQKNLRFPYYWMKWEGQNIFGCRGCVEMKSTIPGHHYVYQKNSILLCGPWDKVAQKDIGNNIQPNSLQQVENHHYFSCDGGDCGGGFQGIGCARYINLGCRVHPSFKSGGHIDLCERCIDGFTQHSEVVINALMHQGYSPNHPFLRVLYNVKGYYEY